MRGRGKDFFYHSLVKTLGEAMLWRGGQGGGSEEEAKSNMKQKLLHVTKNFLLVYSLELPMLLLNYSSEFCNFLKWTLVLSNYFATTDK